MEIDISGVKNGIWIIAENAKKIQEYIQNQISEEFCLQDKISKNGADFYKI